MRFTNTARLAAAVFAMVLTCAAAASDEKDARIDELTDQVNELKAQMQDLEAATGDNWLNKQRANEIRGLVQDVLADADTRASLLQDGLTAGYNKHFFVGSADGNFLMEFAMKLQTRWILNSADQAAGEDDVVYGFEQRRTELYWMGHVFDPRLTYKVKVNASKSDGKVGLDDAYIGYKFTDEWSGRVGQFKVPFLQEYLVSSGRQQAVERSYVNHVFNVNRSQGIEGRYKTDQWCLAGMLHDGTKAKNTAFSADASDFAFAVRGDFIVAGDWKQFKDFVSWRGQEFGLKLGGAIDVEVGESGGGTDTANFVRYTADAQAEFGGWNLYGTLVGQSIDGNDSASFPDADQYGLLIQGGVFLTDKVDVFARYEYVDFDGVVYNSAVTSATPTTDDAVNLVTVGMNYYFKKEKVKFSADLVWVLDPLPDADAGAGLRASPNADQFVVRTQMQLYF